jgi:hypothetical protein
MDPTPDILLRQATHFSLPQLGMGQRVENSGKLTEHLLAPF